MYCRHAPPGQQHGTPTLVGLAAEFVPRTSTTTATTTAATGGAPPTPTLPATVAAPLLGDGGAYQFRTQERTAAGEQALTCYGVHTQLELLLHYGFILPHNPHDQLVLEPDGEFRPATDTVAAMQYTLTVDGTCVRTCVRTCLRTCLRTCVRTCVCVRAWHARIFTCVRVHTCARECA